MDLWSELARHQDLCILEFRNITSFPVSDRYSSPKASYLRNAEAHILISAETHVCEDQVELMTQYLNASGRWSCTVSNAKRTGVNSSQGGLVLQARKYLATTPIEQSTLASITRWELPFNFLVARILCHKQCDILIVGGYFREGLNSVETWTQLVALTQRGSLPFLLFADFNCTPEEVEKSEWLFQLDAVVKHSGGATSTKRNIDYVIHSNSLSSCLTNLQSSWCDPFATHAGIRLGIHPKVC